MRFRMHKSVAAVAAWVGVASLLAIQAMAPAHAAGKISVKWLGHATFEVTSPGGTKNLLDPFILKNPKTPKELKDLSLFKPDLILVTHSHFDHSADAVAIAKATGVKILGISDHMRALDRDPNKEVIRTNPGGKAKVKDVTVHVVPAMHSSSPGGRAAGDVLEFADGRTLYDTGDTWIFGDMALIQEIFKPNIILLQAGGGPFNQDPKIAALAIKKYFKPNVIIPMHYGTFGILASEADVKKEMGGDARVKFMQPGQTMEF